MANEYVTLKNRTNQLCIGTWNGRQYEIKPGSTTEHPKVRAIKFREQNPVMGSQNPRTGSMIYKLGVVEMRDPCDPLTDEFLARFEGAVEKWDRTQLTGARPSEVVAGDNGIFSARDVAASLPSDSTFVKQ